MTTKFLSALFLACVYGICLCQSDCPVKIPKGNWKAEVKEIDGTLLSSEIGSAIVTPDAKGVRLDDLSAGLLGKLGFVEKLTCNIQINCSQEVKSDEFETRFGRCYVTDGSWNQQTKTLAVHWEIPFNELQVITVFSLQ